MNICIRADGGSQIGMGHIMRTLVLARELNINHNVFYACRVDKPLTIKYSLGIEKVKKEGFNVIQIDENELKQKIKMLKADCIITDSYDVDEDYFNILKENFKISGCLDDEKICEYFNVDFLINQNPYAESLDYRVNNNTDLMLGCRYAILRKEFRNVVPKHICKTIKKIMITVGGSDNYNLTEKILCTLEEFDGIVDVVVGPAFIFVDELKKYENEKVRLHYNADMSELMKQCDLAISSCGSTLYELAVSQVPTIGIVVAENQMLAAQTMSDMGLIKYSEIEDLYSEIKYYTFDRRLEASEKMRNLVDGRGCERIVKCLERML